MTKEKNPLNIRIKDPLEGDPCPLLGKCPITKNVSQNRLPFKECTIKAFEGCGFNPKLCD